MSTVVGIGAGHEMEGFALAGVTVIPAATDDELAAAWNGLGREVGLVILTPAAAARLESRLSSRSDLLTVVMP